MAKKSSAKKPSTKRSVKRGSQKRDTVNTGSDARYVKRRTDGTFKESDDVGRAQRTDRPKKAKTAARSGYGDQGDRPKKR